jgi:hypothetical protein
MFKIRVISLVAAVKETSTLSDFDNLPIPLSIIFLYLKTNKSLYASIVF